MSIPCYSGHYTNHYYFAPMESSHWELFKYPERYHTIKDNSAIDNLRQLYFIPQRAANEFAADHGDRGLHAFIDEVRGVIEQPTFAKEGTFMDLAETVQLIGHAQASDATRAKLARVIESLKRTLPDMEQAALKQWQSLQQKASAA